MENPIKMDDLGVPLFLETPIYIYISYQKRGKVPIAMLDVQEVTKLNISSCTNQASKNRRKTKSGEKAFCTQGELVGHSEGTFGFYEDVII